MHELSIALSIVDLVLEEPAVAAGARVDAVRVTVGALSGVAKDALVFSYEIACQDSPLAGSRLIVEELPVLVFCTRCNGQQAVESPLSTCCAVCGMPAAEIVQGRELTVSSLEVLI